MSVTSTQRWVAIAVLLLAVVLLLNVGAHSKDGTGPYLLAAVLLAIGWLVLRLPAAAPDSRSAPSAMFEVPIAFIGEPLNVLWRLQAEDWVLGGHGTCGAADHDGFVAIQVEAGDQATAKRLASQAVARTGARVAEVGVAKPLLGFA